MRNNIEKVDFLLSEEKPIAVVHHKSLKRHQKLYYNMHFELELGVVLNGKMSRYTGEYKQEVSPGEVWLSGIWEPHGAKTTSDNTEAVVMIIYPPILIETQFDKLRPIRLLELFKCAPENRPQPGNKKTKSKLIQLALEVANINAKPKPLRNAFLKLKLFEILLTLMETWKTSVKPSPQNSNELAVINKAIDLIFSNPKGISTQQAANECSINRNSFAKMFSQAMGMKFCEFGLRFRVSQAANQLKNSSMPIKQIAFEYGFSNVSHMHRTFVKFYNQTPKEFRNTL